MKKKKQQKTCIKSKIMFEFILNLNINILMLIKLDKFVNNPFLNLNENLKKISEL